MFEFFLTDPDDAFIIDPSTGFIFVSDPDKLDRESKASFPLSVSMSYIKRIIHIVIIILQFAGFALI